MKRYLLLLLILFIPLLVQAEEELLEPEKAFALSASMTDAQTIRAEWAIADGYYMYRNNFAFKPLSEGVEFGTPEIPAGKIKNDEFFGEIEIFKKSVGMEVPLLSSHEPGSQITVNFIGQGCNEPMGVCYPPLHSEIVLTVPAAAAPAEAGGLAALTELTKSVDQDDEELLEPDAAFAFNIEVEDSSTLIAHWDIAKNYYLYQDKIRLNLKDAQGTVIGPIAMPKAKTKEDPVFGKTMTYEGSLTIRLPLIRDENAPDNLIITADYQGCNEVVGVCYPPISKEIPVSLTGAPAATAATSTAVTTSAATESTASNTGGVVSEQDELASKLASGNTALTLLTFFGLGLLLAFTPCVFPMIPILSGIIIGQGKEISTRQAFMLSLAYVLAMAATYTIAGVLAGLFGANIQVWFQNPWVLGVFAAVFVILSFSMFGFYELQMPASIQSRLTEVSNKQKSGSLTGAAVMGFLSALIVGPCVTAPLIGALIYIGQTGDAVLGGAALFFLSMGMGAPLLLIGTSAGKLLPRAGAWMDATKAVFGVLLIGVAIWLIERVIPATVSMILWAVLIIISAIYMGALDSIKEGASGWMKLWKGTGVVMLIWGSLMLIGAAAGGGDMFKPLKGVGGGAVVGQAAVQTDKLPFKMIKSMADLEREIESARQNRQFVMLDFYADWCISCKEMEKFTFSKPEVHEALDGVVLLKIDVTANNEDDKEILKAFGLFGPPAILFFDQVGFEKKNFRVVGFVPADEFVAHIQKVRGAS
jgi:thiol:disulfide interchange protein DsbD